MNSNRTARYQGPRIKRRHAALFAVMMMASCIGPAETASPARTGPAASPVSAAPAPYTPGATVPVPGTFYSMADSTPGDVVYLAGDLPVIISVPHGGSLSPDIPSRAKRCSIINTNDDDATIDLALDIVKAIRNATDGGYPHVIMNNLSRTKIDQNRDRGQDCNPTTGRGGAAWSDFHDRFTGAVAIPAVLKKHGSGLYIDLHGKPDGYGSDIIIGYNLTAAELSNSDRHLNTGKKSYADKSSIRFLSKKLGAAVDFADLLRGDRTGHESFGHLLQKELHAPGTTRGRKYRVSPRPGLKKPLLNLSGGYNIKAFCGVRDGSFNNPYGYNESRFISGFQIEVSRGLRVRDARLREEFARALAAAVIAYVERNFGIAMRPAD